MSRLIASGFVVTETTFVGTTAGSQSSLAAGSAGNVTIRQITAYGVSSVAQNSSGGINFVTGDSSASPNSTLTLIPGPTSEGIAVTLAGLRIETKWFEARTNEAGQYGVFVMGD